MRIKIKILKNILSVLCAAAITTTCGVSFVGAVPSGTKNSADNNDIKSDLLNKFGEYVDVRDKYRKWRDSQKIDEKNDLVSGDFNKKVREFCNQNPSVISSKCNDSLKMQEAIKLMNDAINAMNSFKNNKYQIKLIKKISKYNELGGNFYKWRNYEEISKENDLSREFRKNLVEFVKNNKEIFEPGYNDISKMTELNSLLDDAIDMMEYFKNNPNDDTGIKLKKKLDEYDKIVEKFHEWRNINQISEEDDSTHEIRVNVKQFCKQNSKTLDFKNKDVLSKKKLLSMLDDAINAMNDFEKPSRKIQIQLTKKMAEYKKTVEKFLNWMDMKKVKEENDSTRQFRANVDNFITQNPGVVDSNFYDISKMQELITMIDGAVNKMNTFETVYTEQLEAKFNRKCDEYNQKISAVNRWMNYHRPISNVRGKVLKEDPNLRIQKIIGPVNSRYDEIKNNLDSDNVEEFSQLVGIALEKMNFFVEFDAIAEVSDDLEKSQCFDSESTDDTVK